MIRFPPCLVFPEVPGTVTSCTNVTAPMHVALVASNIRFVPASVGWATFIVGLSEQVSEWWFNAVSATGLSGQKLGYFGIREISPSVTDNAIRLCLTIA